MNGYCHTLVANFALACLPFEERQVLRPRWNGLEGRCHACCVAQGRAGSGVLSS